MATKTKKTTPVFDSDEEDIIEEAPALIPAPTIKDSSEETITFKKSHFYSVLVVLAFAVGVLVGYVVWGPGSGRSTATAAAAQAAAQAPAGAEQAPQYRRYDIPTEGFPSLGPEDAPIVIVEFSDFQCPFCRRFHDETYQSLLEAYPGQIRFVYRNLPLTSIHPAAMPSAIASLCAKDQNAYWDYHEKLFSSEQLDEETFIRYAADLGLDTEKFTACLASGEHDAEIQEDMSFAIDLGVQSTPTFFVNGLAIVGAQPLANFQQLIDKELAGEIP